MKMPDNPHLLDVDLRRLS